MKLSRRMAASGGAGLLALALVACGDTSEESAPADTSTPSATDTTADSSDTESEHNDADTTFAQMMIVHHEGAIEMSDLALESAESEEVRTLAETISAAQGPEIEEMTSWLEAWGEDTAPADHGGMDHAGMDLEGMSQEEAMAELEELSGEEFDRRFLELMIAHHEGAVVMAETELEQGENAEALELAERVIDDQTTEIALMQEMLQDL